MFNAITIKLITNAQISSLVLLILISISRGQGYYFDQGLWQGYQPNIYNNIYNSQPQGFQYYMNNNHLNKETDMKNYKELSSSSSEKDESSSKKGESKRKYTRLYNRKECKCSCDKCERAKRCCVEKCKSCTSSFMTTYIKSHTVMLVPYMVPIIYTPDIPKPTTTFSSTRTTSSSTATTTSSTTTTTTTSPTTTTKSSTTTTTSPTTTTTSPTTTKTSPTTTTASPKTTTTTSPTTTTTMTTDITTQSTLPPNLRQSTKKPIKKFFNRSTSTFQAKDKKFRNRIDAYSHANQHNKPVCPGSKCIPKRKTHYYYLLKEIPNAKGYHIGTSLLKENKREWDFLSGKATENKNRRKMYPENYKTKENIAQEHNEIIPLEHTGMEVNTKSKQSFSIVPSVEKERGNYDTNFGLEETLYSSNYNENFDFDFELYPEYFEVRYPENQHPLGSLEMYENLTNETSNIHKTKISTMSFD